MKASIHPSTVSGTDIVVSVISRDESGELTR
jgi:hypothetical protein